METSFRGFRIARDDIIRAMHQFDDELRDDYLYWRLYAVRHDGKIYPPKELIRLATNHEIGRFSGGERAANTVFNNLSFEVITINNDSLEEEIIDEAIDTSISLERDLEKLIINDITVIETGLQIYKTEDEFGVQYDTNAVGRIDILAIDHSGKYVVIELKAGEAGDKVVGQILRYMGWVRMNKSGDKEVRGIIVANGFHPGVRYAVSLLPNVGLRNYEVRFDIEEVKGI